MEEDTEQYTALAGHYDRLTFDVDYKGWAAFAQKMFRKHHIPGKLILELACGTGSLSYELAWRGFDMISSDISPDMLSVAREKCAGLEHMPMFICQDMTRIDLYGGVSGCVCGLDSVNYVTDIRGLRRMFRRVSTFLEPGGLFLFDVKSTGLFEEMAGTCSAWEEDGLFAVWEYGYDCRTMRASHTVDIFEETGGLYRRYSEIHYQRAYTVDTLTDMINESQLELLGIYSDLKQTPYSGENGRLYFAAVKTGGNTNE